MKEPNWEDVAEYNVEPMLHDIVWVNKKTRGRFGPGKDKAMPGDHGIVVSKWTSTMGSIKLMLITKNMKELGTTSTCVYRMGHIDDPNMSEWSDHLKLWMTQTYVPIIVMRELKDKKWRKENDPYVISKDRKSILVTGLTGKGRTWLGAKHVHPDDWGDVMAMKHRCLTVRVPGWLAIKSGLM